MYLLSHNFFTYGHKSCGLIVALDFIFICKFPSIKFFCPESNCSLVPANELISAKLWSGRGSPAEATRQSTVLSLTSDLRHFSKEHHLPVSCDKLNKVFPLSMLSADGIPQNMARD